MGEKAARYDVAIIGAGPGGEASARRSAWRGARVCLIDACQLGGACLHVGCIPTKAMLHASETFHAGRGATVDGEAFMRRVHDVVGGLAKGLERTLESAGVEVIRGRGRLCGPHTVAVELSDGGSRRIEAESIILAAGSSPTRVEGFPWHSSNLWTTDAAAAARSLPASVLIVGGGPIGCEFATIYSELGIPVTLIEMWDRLLPGLDEDASRFVERSLRRRGTTTRLATLVVRMTADSSGVEVELSNGQTAQAAVVLVAVGRRANIDGLGLDTADVVVADGIVPVNDRCRTNVPHIYAVGDLAEHRQYAHLAARMGVVAAENAAGWDVADDRGVVPIGVFTHPEVAAVGISEASARADGDNVRIAAVQYQATATGWAYDQRDGLVKLIADDATGRLLGGVVVGYRATEVVSELTLAVKHKLSVAQLAETIHMHPTFAEGVGLAAQTWLRKTSRSEA